MRTLGWLIALLANCWMVALFSPSMLAGDIFGIVLTALFSAIPGLLVAARAARVSPRMRAAMKALCWAVVPVWLSAVVAHGGAWGLEPSSLVFAGLIAWGSWRAFLLYALPPASVDVRGVPAAETQTTEPVRRPDSPGIASCVAFVVSVAIFYYVKAHGLFMYPNWDAAFGGASLLGAVLAVGGILRSRGTNRLPTVSIVGLLLNMLPTGMMLIVFALGSMH